MVEAGMNTAAAAHEAVRDRGLDRGIGTFALAVAIVNGVIGAGIFTLPTQMAQTVGAMAPWAYVACALAMGAVVICFAEAGSRLPTSGGAYGWVEAAFGPLAAFVTGVLLWVSAALAAGAIAAAFVDSLASFAPAFAGFGARTAVLLLVFATFAWINIRGVRTGTGFIAVATMVKLIPLALFVVVGAAFADWSAAPAVATAPIDPNGFGRAVIIALFAYSGMETTLATSGEVARPARTVPRALLMAMGFVLLFYVAIQLVAQGLLGGALATSVDPLADGIAKVDPRLGVLLLAGATFSRLIWLAGDVLGAPRILFALGRDGLIPAVFGKVHPVSKAPHIAIMTHAGVAALLAITGSFASLVILSSLTSAAIYLFVCAAVLVLRRRGVAVLGEPLSFRILPVAAPFGILSMMVIIGLAQWGEIAGLIGTIAVSAAVFVAMKVVRRGALT